MRLSSLFIFVLAIISVVRLQAQTYYVYTTITVSSTMTQYPCTNATHPTCSPALNTGCATEININISPSTYIPSSHNYTGTFIPYNVTYPNSSSTYSNRTITGTRKVTNGCSSFSDCIFTRPLEFFDPGVMQDFGINCFGDGERIKIKYTPNQASIPVVTNGQSVFCPGDVVTITSNDLYIGKNRRYVFRAYYNGVLTGETYSTTGSPVWFYTVPAFSSTTPSRTFSVQIYGIANALDNSPIPGPISPMSATTVYIYHPQPTVTPIKLNSPTCSGDNDASYVISISGYKNATISGINNSPSIRILDTYTLSIKSFNGSNYDGQKPFENPGDSSFASNGIYTINGGNFALFQGLKAGNYQMQVKNYYSGSGNACFTPVPFTITEPPVINIGYYVNSKSGTTYNASCSPNNDAYIQSSASGGNGAPYVYSIAGVTAFNSGSNITNLYASPGGSTYQVQVRDSKGCLSPLSSPFTIYSPPPLTISRTSFSNYNSYDISCFGGNNGTVQLNLSGGAGIGSYNYTLAGNGFSPVKNGLSVRSATFAGLNADTFTGYAMDGLGCLATFPGLEMKAPPPLSITGINRTSEFNNLYNGFDVSCFSSSDGQVKINATGGITSPAYSYSSNGTNYVFGSVFTNLPSNTLLGFYVKDANGCITTSSISLNNVPSALSISGIAKALYNGFNVSCNASNGTNDNGRITLSGTGGISNKEYTFSIGGVLNPKTAFVTTVFSALSAGSHNYSIQDYNFCVFTGNFNLSEPPALQLTSFAKQEPSCYGYANGFINTQAQGGVVGIYHYALSGSAYNTTLAGASIANFPNIVKDNYSLNITDINNCSFTTTVGINEPGSLQINSLLGIVVCKSDVNGYMVADVSGGTLPYTYIWATTSVSGSLNSLNTLAGTTATISGLAKNAPYSLHFNDVNNCASPSSYLVKTAMLSEPVDFIRFKPSTLSQPLCFGLSNGFILLSVTGGWGSYQYSSDDGVSYSPANTSFTNLVTGNYRYFTKDKYGCIKDTTLFLTQPQTLGLAAQAMDVTCFNIKNGKVLMTATGGTFPFHYAIKTGTTPFFIDSPNANISFTGLDIGSYTTSLTDKNNCSTAGITLAISQPTALQLALSNVGATCGYANGSANSTVTGGVFPYTYLWTPSNGSSPGITQVKSGNQILKAVDANLCTISGNTIISDTDGPVVGGQLVSPTTCSYSADGVASIYLISIPANKTVAGYSWVSSEPNTTISSTTTIASGLTAFQNVSGLAQDNEGCLGSATIYIESPDPLLLTLAGIVPVCFNDANGQIAASVKGGTQPYTYLWNDSLQQTTATATHLKGYTDVFVQIKNYQLLATDNHLCTVIGKSGLANPMKVVVDLGADSVTLCEGQTFTQGKQDINLSVQWVSDNGFASQSPQPITFTQAGLYTLIVTNDKGCAAKDSFRLITSKDLLNASFAAVDSIFVGDTVRLAEISWPVPDTIIWTLPKGVKLLENATLNVADDKKGKEYIYIIADSAGLFDLGLEAHLANCVSELDKMIVVTPSNGNRNQGARWGYKGIKSYQAFPSPTSGLFQLKVELTDVRPLSVTIFNALSEPVYHLEAADQAQYENEIDLSAFPSGLYAIALNTPGNQKIIRIVKQ